MQPIIRLPQVNSMEDKGITTYTLINKYGVNPRTINNLRHNKSITMFTLEKLCLILDCNVENIITIKKE